MTHIQRLRKWCEPVQEDTPVPSREHKTWVDRRDLKQLLADYDAALQSLAQLEQTYREDMGFGK